jgi:hypothetical protein
VFSDESYYESNHKIRMTIPSLPLTSSNFSPFAFNTDQYNPFHYALRDQTEWFHVEKNIQPYEG